MAALELQPEGRSGAGRIRCRVPADGRTGWVSLRAADDGRGAVAVAVHVCDGVTEIYPVVTSICSWQAIVLDTTAAARPAA
eukprot:COSAG01_NODE_43737_length_426_cov_6.226300_1_plen_80_part_10